MTKKYGLYNFTFDKMWWSALMARAASEIDKDVLAEMLNISASAIHNWSVGRYAEGFEHPSMSNFLRICNMLDVDPREFFVLE